MSTATYTGTYTGFELRRTFRNRRFFIFTLGFPLILFLTVAGPNRNQSLDHIPFPLYYMAGMVAWGTMGAVLAGGARIALERQVGWSRQLRVTPLTSRTYFGAKVISGYAMALLNTALLYVAGLTIGIRLPAASWLEMTALVLIGLIPFSILGILVGHLLTPESFGPALGGGTALLALLSGAWGPLVQHGILLDVVKALPSYWLVQAGKASLGGGGWPIKGWLVVAAWSVALAALATRVYRRDTGRI
jgi:ABC-2 type transport system permease protein